MKTVNILGAGNIAHFFAEVIHQNKDLHMLDWYARRPQKIQNPNRASNIVRDIEQLQAADLTILAVADQGIKKVAQQLPSNQSFVVHTSGATSIEVLSTQIHYGVLYPLQSISINNKPANEVPICIESTSHLEDLRIFAEKLNIGKVYALNSKQRLKLHLSAVFANNFSNHLLHIAQDIIADSKHLAICTLFSGNNRKLKHMTAEKPKLAPCEKIQKH